MSTWLLAVALGVQAASGPPEQLTCKICYLHWIARSSLGAGLRFNNPFRLQTSLGEDNQSVSATSAYFDQLLGVFLGDPEGWQHGATVSWSTALSGVPQDVLVPSYAVYYRLSDLWSLHGRVGAPILLRPDGNVGMELAWGGTWLARGGVGVFAEVVGSLFWGAATYDRGATTIPLLSVQGGLSLEIETFP